MLGVTWPAVPPPVNSIFFILKVYQKKQYNARLKEEFWYNRLMKNIIIKDIMTLEGIKKTVYIQNHIIAGIDKEPVGFKADKIINGAGKLLIPGLINTHTHSYMSLFRNVADDLSFEDWLFKNIEPLEEKLLPEDAYFGAMLSMIEMIKTGTTCFLDMQMHIHQTSKAAEESGMRAVITRGLVGTGRDDEGGSRRINEAREEMEAFKNNDRISFMYGPHAPYSCDMEYLSKVAELAAKDNLGINIHLAESKFEIFQMQEKYGLTPIEVANKAGVFDVHCVAAHCVNLTENDIQILKDKNVNVAINPKSNMKLGNGFAPVKDMLDGGVNLTLGTDGAASNNSLNLFSEMNAAALIYKGNLQDSQAVSAGDIYRFVTENAAKAVNMEGQIGAIKENMKADLCIINTDTPGFRPKNNMISALSYSASGYEVETVIVNGKILMENKILTTIDEEKIYYETEKICERIGIERRF